MTAVRFAAYRKKPEYEQSVLEKLLWAVGAVRDTATGIVLGFFRD